MVVLTLLTELPCVSRDTNTGQVGVWSLRGFWHLHAGSPMLTEVVKGASVQGCKGERVLTILLSWCPIFNTLRPRQNGRHFADDIFKCILLNENAWIPNKISLKFVPKGPINNISSLVQIMAWRRPGDKPLSEPMMVRSLMHICVTRPQWVKSSH